MEMKICGFYFQILYVMKPIAHLCSMSLYGQRNWKPWLLALGLDLARYVLKSLPAYIRYMCLLMREIIKTTTGKERLNSYQRNEANF